MRACTLPVLAFSFALTCLASETVYLTSGFSLIADSHTEQDGLYVLHIGSGTVEYPAADISSIVPNAEPAVETSQTVSSKPEAVLTRAAQSAGVDEIFVRSVAKVESGLRQDAVSKKGALGLMQLMPQTAAQLGVDAKEADQNASGGVRYLRALLERYHYNPVLALAAYNAGPGAVTKYRGIPPYYETRVYVVRVLKEYERQLKLAGFRRDGTQTAQASNRTADVNPKTPTATN